MGCVLVGALKCSDYSAGNHLYLVQGQVSRPNRPAANENAGDHEPGWFVVHFVGSDPNRSRHYRSAARLVDRAAWTAKHRDDGSDTPNPSRTMPPVAVQWPTAREYRGH